MNNKEQVRNIRKNEQERTRKNKKEQERNIRTDEQ